MRSRSARGVGVAVALLGVTLASCAARRDQHGPVTPPPAPTPAVAAAPQPTPAPQPVAAQTPPHRTVVLIGDSTTYGTPPPEPGVKGGQSPYNPGATLEALLATLEPLPGDGGTPWRGARVHNLAVGASTTKLWLDPPVACGSFMELFPIVKVACARKVSWVDAVPDAVGGATIDAVIVDLGINDLLITNDPRETVDRLVEIRNRLKPIPVIFYPPIAPKSGPRGDWPRRVRAEMERRGLFAESEYPNYLPTFDGLHPTHGGYAAMGGLWLDGLRKLP